MSGRLALMHTIVAMSRSAARQLVITLASVLLPDAEDSPEAELTTEHLHTISFGLDGTTYEIDLSPADAGALRAGLAPWVEHARSISEPTATPTTRRRTSRTTAGAHPATTIRQWARTHGYPVSDRGRLPTTVLQAYQADH
jgi:hypothetical protein